MTTNHAALAVLLCGCATAATPAAEKPEPSAPAPTTAPAPTPTADAGARAPAASASVAEPPKPAEPAPVREVGDACRVGRKRGRGSLDEILEPARCRVEQALWIEPYDLSAFDITVTPRSLRVQRGKAAELSVVIRAHTDAILQLDVSCSRTPVETSVHDTQSERIDDVGESVAMLCRREISQVRLDGGDDVTLRVPFEARTRRFTENGPEPVGPLPAGKFELWLTLPIDVGKDWKPEVLKIPLQVTR